MNTLVEEAHSIMEIVLIQTIFATLCIDQNKKGFWIVID